MERKGIGAYLDLFRIITRRVRLRTVNVGMCDGAARVGRRAPTLYPIRRISCGWATRTNLGGGIASDHI